MVSLKHDDKLQEGSECSFQVLCQVFATWLFTWKLLTTWQILILFKLTGKARLIVILSSL